MSRPKKPKPITIECPFCYDCKWITADDQAPFYGSNFDDLKPGDELIRCPSCNEVKIAKPRRARKKHKGWSSTQH